MNAHILVIEDDQRSVEVFKSRREMTSRRTSLKTPTIMFPPIEIRRSVKGVLQIAELVNSIHIKGPYAVLEEIEDAV